MAQSVKRTARRTGHRRSPARLAVHLINAAHGTRALRRVPRPHIRFEGPDHWLLELPHGRIPACTLSGCECAPLLNYSTFSVGKTTTIIRLEKHDPSLVNYNSYARAISQPTCGPGLLPFHECVNP
jgi:hypothetical protein